MKNLLTTTKLVIGLLVLLIAGSISAYVLLSPARTWDSAPTYIVDERGLETVLDGDGGVAAVVSAITSNLAWNGAGAGTIIKAQKGSVANWQLGDGIPMLNFSDPERVCSGNCLAATFTGFYQQRADGSYKIFDADIVTNTRRIDWTSTQAENSCSGEFYIEGVMVHEAGHGLGLGHTNVSGATMYPSVSSCNNGPATIESDDRAAINALYGSQNPPPQCTLGQRNDSCTSDAECCSGKCRGKAGNLTCR